MVGNPILPSAQLPTKWTLSSVPALDSDGLTVQARLIVSHKILSLKPLLPGSCMWGKLIWEIRANTRLL